MSQQSAELPEEEAIHPSELNDEGAGLGMGENNTFEPEEEPDADPGTESPDADTTT